MTVRTERRDRSPAAAAVATEPPAPDARELSEDVLVLVLDGGLRAEHRPDDVGEEIRTLVWSVPG